MVDCTVDVAEMWVGLVDCRELENGPVGRLRLVVR